MNLHPTLASVTDALGNRILRVRPGGPRHIVDQLLAERTLEMSRHPLWPLARPLLYRILGYKAAVALVDEIAPHSGWDAFARISSLLSLDLSVRGTENIPSEGGFILAPTHPTGLADGVAIFDLMRTLRPDLVFFANRDALRVNKQFRELIIPVEWRASAKTHAKSRDTLEMTARAFAEKRACVLFPAGRIAYRHEGRLMEPLWQSSVVGLARRYCVPVIPVNITARNSGLFHLLSSCSTELRYITLFYELLNKKGGSFHLTVGRPITPDRFEGDPTEVAAALREHATTRLAENPAAVFAMERQEAAER